MRSALRRRDATTPLRGQNFSDTGMQGNGMSLLPWPDTWDFLVPKPADAQTELRALVAELLKDELDTLDVDGTLQKPLDQHLHVVVVDVVANTMQQLIEHTERNA